MESKNKLYIVSFGDSRKYRFPFVELPSEDGLHHSDRTPLANMEKELNEYLKKEFPDDNFAYFTTPKVTEVDWDHRDKYESYPLLDGKAIEEIKKVLSEEVKDMRSTQEMNDDAPFSDVNAAAV